MDVCALDCSPIELELFGGSMVLTLKKGFPRWTGIKARGGLMRHLVNAHCVAPLK